MALLPRHALIVGVSTYEEPMLYIEAPVHDARAMARLLASHYDGSPNYVCTLLADTIDENGTPITEAALWRECVRHLENFTGDVLFYYSGHCHMTPGGAVLGTWEGQLDDPGVSMAQLLILASSSPAREIVFILDCCHAGAFGGGPPLAHVRENMTVIAATGPAQDALAQARHSLFTELVVEALDGGAADHMGLVTAPHVYSFTERLVTEPDQRPVYRSHATSVPLIRRCPPSVEPISLRRIVELFPQPGHQYELDPGYESRDEAGRPFDPVDEEKLAIMALFRAYRDAGLLTSVIPGEHLYWAALRSHPVQLTAKGRGYWQLVKQRGI
jgi:hypothetical protein